MINPIFPDRREQFREMELKMQRTANPVKYNLLMCQRIHDRAGRVPLPKLSRPEMSKLKDHLKEFRKNDGESMRIKFLNLRNCFLIINKFEEHEEMRAKIQPILAWLDEYKYIFDLIMESQGMKESPMLDKALIILHLDITEFNILYAYMLTEADVNPLDFAPIDVQEEPLPVPPASEPEQEMREQVPAYEQEPFDNGDSFDDAPEEFSNETPPQDDWPDDFTDGTSEEQTEEEQNDNL